MPDAFELPRVLRAVIKLVSAHLALIHKLVALAFGRAPRADQFIRVAPGSLPRLAAIVGALDNLPKPAARLRGIDAVRLNRRAFEMIHLPARKMRAVDFPALALAI